MNRPKIILEDGKPKEVVLLLEDYEELLEQLESVLRPRDPDLRYLRGLRSGEVLMLSTEREDASLNRDLWVDPRTGRFYLPGLQRGGRGSSRLLLNSNFARDNRSRGGSAWPFGPSFHPITQGGHVVGAGGRMMLGDRVSGGSRIGVDQLSTAPPPPPDK